MAFDLPTFLDNCRHAVRGDATHKAALAVMKAAFTDPEGVMTALGAPDRPGLWPLHVAPDLTVLNVVWGPGATIRPHNHNTWAIIGIYLGREDNTFWRRRERAIEPASRKTLNPGEVAPLGRDIIHSVTNPLQTLTGAIHVYGGDFFTIARSEWNAAGADERPYDIEKTRAMFRD